MLRPPTHPPANLPEEASALRKIIAQRQAANTSGHKPKPATPFNSAL
jgi:hypothetical protein